MTNSISAFSPQRVHHELRFRKINVVDKQIVAGSFYRIIFSGEDLNGFIAPGFDDHIKIFFPDRVSGQIILPKMTSEGIVWPEGEKPIARDYTPLLFDTEKGHLVIDFYMHERGVANDWAAKAKPGDAVVVAGPRSSMVVPENYSYQLYICDETGLPAFKRRAPLLKGSHTILYAFAEQSMGEVYLGQLPHITENWLGKGSMWGKSLESLQQQLQSITLVDDYFIWITGEAAAVKSLKDFFIDKFQCDKQRLHAMAYWHR